jgi:hypothetical protein
MFRLSVFPVHFPEKTRNPETVTETHGLTLYYYTRAPLYRDITLQSYKSFFSRNQKSFYFDANPELDGENAIITAIEYVDPLQQPFTLNGRQTETVDSMAQSGAVLYISDFKRTLIAQLPVKPLSVTQVVSSLPLNVRNGKKTFTHFTSQKWQNCYVEFTDTSFLNANNSILFRIHYNKR